jgi:CO/xanthine dehydrogenase Mo-binding subunit
MKDAYGSRRRDDLTPVYGSYVTFSYIADFVEVRIEPETRRIRVPRVVSVADCGRVMSPRTAASQVRGGVVWGIGAALREVSEVDPRYGGFLNADLAEYVVPVNADTATGVRFETFQSFDQLQGLLSHNRLGARAGRRAGQPAAKILTTGRPSRGKRS